MHIKYFLNITWKFCSERLVIHAVLIQFHRSYITLQTRRSYKNFTTCQQDVFATGL